VFKLLQISIINNEKTINIYCEVSGDMAVVYRADPSTRAAKATFIFVPVLKYSKKIANAKQ